MGTGRRAIRTARQLESKLKSKSTQSNTNRCETSGLAMLLTITLPFQKLKDLMVNIISRKKDRADMRDPTNKRATTHRRKRRRNSLIIREREDHPVYGL